MPRDAPAAQPGGTRETPQELWIVDTDVHVHEDPGELAAYAEPPWDVALREIAKVEERYLDLPALSPRAEFQIPWPGGSNRPQVVETAAAMRTSEARSSRDHGQCIALADIRLSTYEVRVSEAGEIRVVV